MDSQANEETNQKPSMQINFNNKLILFLAAGAVIVLIVILIAKSTPKTPTVTQKDQGSKVLNQQPTTETSVEIKNHSFNPKTLTVKVGSVVTWTNKDSVPHTATANDQSFDTGNLKPGDSGSARFPTAGTYTYHCSIHPDMVGTIVVK